MTVDEFQNRIEELYLQRDKDRGIAGTFLWFTEEVGELARALKTGDREQLRGEFADVFAWLATLASLAGIRLEEVASTKYGPGCPKCRSTPCACPWR